MTYQFHGYCRLQQTKLEFEFSDSEREALNDAFTVLGSVLSKIEPPEGKAWLIVGEAIACNWLFCHALAKVLLVNDKRTFTADSPWSEFVYDGEGEDLFVVEVIACDVYRNLSIDGGKVWFNAPGTNESEPFESVFEQIKAKLPQAS